MPDKYMDDSEINSEPDKYIIERTLIMNMEQALENAKLIRELQMQNDIKKMANGVTKDEPKPYQDQYEEGSLNHYLSSPEGDWVWFLIFFGGIAAFTWILIAA